MNLFSALDVSASGLTAQRARAELLAENLANAETTRTPQGGPYRRKDAVFTSAEVSNSFAGVFDEVATGVAVADVVVDARDPEKRYLPGHPDADADGYVGFPRINPAEDMVDLMGAARSYEANVTAIAGIKDLIQRSIDLLR